ncbi:E3 ubiquitin-protein ligase PDZRN3-like [Cololabis saira]|uniref:E3 ubiquitin-protein ligase PDZRN3-like n=1 Tax=Cololabis saira TaxID=129043 RepID=UPI002AD1E2A4|nr:E3 ubiquitin-protein ligase PDZRN3-like [Cololabis saira]
MESQREPHTGPRGGPSICQRGCGLPLAGSGSSISPQEQQHCCVDALRALTDALEDRAAALQHQARMARLRWNRREQSLLTQVTALQSEARLAALQHQRRLHQYLLHINGITQQVGAYCKSDSSPAADMQNHTSDKATCADGKLLEANKTHQMSLPQ